MTIDDSKMYTKPWIALDKQPFRLMPPDFGLCAERAGKKTAEQIEADLVVDASGRGSQTPQWLAELGYKKPVETSVGIHIGYASRLFEPPRNARPAWNILGVYTQAPASKKYGVVQSVENNRWLVTLAGNLRDYPPSDEKGFLEFARPLDHPELYKAIREATPLTPIVDLPQGWLFVGTVGS